MSLFQLFFKCLLVYYLRETTSNDVVNFHCCANDIE